LMRSKIVTACSERNVVVELGDFIAHVKIAKILNVSAGSVVIVRS
jgi:hypothetical protein